MYILISMEIYISWLKGVFLDYPILHTGNSRVFWCPVPEECVHEFGGDPCVRLSLVADQKHWFSDIGCDLLSLLPKKNIMPFFSNSW